METLLAGTDEIILAATQARSLLINGRNDMALQKLEEMSRTIGLLKQGLESNKRMRGVSTIIQPPEDRSLVIDDSQRDILDQVFFSFLARVCGDKDAVDGRGDRVHATLTAEKLHSLQECEEFFPFKFRIKAFTGAFKQDLSQHVANDTAMVCPEKRILL